MSCRYAVYNETQFGPEELGHKLSSGALRGLDAIDYLLGSPAARVLRTVEMRST